MKLLAGFLALCILTVGYALVAKRLSSTILTAPILFICLGAALSVGGLVPPETGEALLHPVAEVALVILLFLDAAQTDLAALRQRRIWPQQMLLIGLPASILLGTFFGALLFPEWSIVTVALAAAILTPTSTAWFSFNILTDEVSTGRLSKTRSSPRSSTSTERWLSFSA